MNRPDKWVVIKIELDGNPIYKVFATWYGGYTGADSWKMNSGIVRVEEDDNTISFYGYSGSCYQCVKKTYGTNMYSQGVLDGVIKRASDEGGITVTVMDEDTDWLNLIKESDEKEL